MKQPNEKISVDQKQVMIEFMENHKEIANVRNMKARASSLYTELWNHLTILLNKTSGPKKDKINWQKVWTGIKKGIRIKVKKIQIYHDKQTGQYIFYPRLNDIDERIISLIKQGNKELDLYSKNLNSKTDSTMKQENLMKDNMNVSPVPAVVREQILGDLSDNSFEESSTSSWNSHVAENRSSVEQAPNNMAMFNEKLNTIMVQLEQIIEQKSVSNILLERIASSLEHRNRE